MSYVISHFFHAQKAQQICLNFSWKHNIILKVEYDTYGK